MRDSAFAAQIRWSATCAVLSIAAYSGATWSARAHAQEARNDRPREHTVEQLVETAVRQWPGTVAAAQRIAAARARLSEVKISPFFQWTATGAFSVVPDARGNPIYTREVSDTGIGGDDDGWNVLAAGEIEGVIPLYTWGKLRAAERAAKQGVEAAESDRERVRAQLRYDVRRAFFGLQLALDILQLVDEGKGKLEKAAARLDERIEAGDPDATDEDRWRLSATIAELYATEAEAKRIERSARAALRILTDIDDVEIPGCTSARTTITLEPVDWFVDAARLHRPEGKMLENAVRARQAQVDIASAQYFPDLGLAFEVGKSVAPGRTNQINPFASDRANSTSYAAGLAARWSLDFWGTHLRVDRAEAELGATRADREAATSGIELEVIASYEEVVESSTLETAWGKAHKDTRAWFLAAAQAYQVGTSDLKDLTDAVKAYFKARGNHLDAIRKHNTALAALERATGMPLLPGDSTWQPTCE